MQATVIEVHGDTLYLEVPGQLRFRCPFRKARHIPRILRDDAVDITFCRQRDRVLAMVNSVVREVSDIGIPSTDQPNSS